MRSAAAGEDLVAYLGVEEAETLLVCFSMREAAELEERAEEENWVGLKSGERKVERIGSEEKGSRKEEEEEEDRGCEVAAEEMGVEGTTVGVLKVEERWRVDMEMAGGALERKSGDG